jgi:iron complex outermembrane receptor protein
MKTRKYTALSGAALAALMGWSSSAMAQDAARSGVQVEEVIVTATKRAENLQDVPISVTAVTAEEIQKRGATSLRDLEFSVPNFAFASNDFNRRPDISLRGITTTARNGGEDGAIGFYVDGVYLARPTDWNSDIQDLERVEVLRGPQGTLFGKNAMAGAINMVTRRPGDTFGGNASVELGNYEHRRITAAVDVPLIEGKLFSRVSFSKLDRDGYARNVFDNSRINDEDRWGGRLQLKARPFENFEVNLSADYMTENPSRIQREVLAGPNPLTFIPGPRTVAFDRKSVNDRTLKGVHLIMEADFGGYQLTSITAYRMSFVDFQVDEDTGPLDDQRTRIVNDNHQFSQELRIASPAGERFDFVAGLFYVNVWADSRGGFVQHGVASPFFPGSTATSGTVWTDSYALFGNGNYRLTDRLTLNAGVRFGYETKQISFTRLNTNGGFFGGVFPNFGPFEDRLIEQTVSPTVGLQYTFSPDVMTYAKWSRGDKSGGWNAGISFRGADPFKPEQVDNFEVGLKSDLLDGRARVNLAAFYMDYRNLQVTTFGGLANGVGFNVDNAAKARIKGFEVDFTLVPTEGLTLSGGLGYLDTEYADYQTSATANNNGNRLTFAPNWTANLVADYERPISSSLTFVARGEWSYRGSQFGTPTNTAVSKAPSYSLINGRVGVSVNDGQWGVYIWGRNLADKDYLLWRDRFGTEDVGGYGPPRMYGVSLNAQF